MSRVCWVRQLSKNATLIQLRCISKHKTLFHCSFDVGPPSTTLAQHQTNNGETAYVSWATLTTVLFTVTFQSRQTGHAKPICCRVCPVCFIGFLMVYEMSGETSNNKRRQYTDITSSGPHYVNNPTSKPF